MTDLSGLKESLLFENFTEEEKSAVAPLFSEKRMGEGTTVFVENMPGESIYLIQQGTIKISKMVAEGQEKILVILGAEDFFGDMALFDGSIRSTTARVAEDALLLKLSKDNFEQLCQKRPATALKLIRNIVREFCRRLRENEQELKQILNRLIGAGE